MVQSVVAKHNFEGHSLVFLGRGGSAFANGLGLQLLSLKAFLDTSNSALSLQSDVIYVKEILLLGWKCVISALEGETREWK